MKTVSILDVEIRDFEIEDGRYLMQNPNEQGLSGQKPENIERWLSLNKSEGPGFTARLDGEIVGCGGIRIYWEGCGEAWILFPANIRSYNISPRTVKYLLNSMIEEYNLVRVQSCPQCNWLPGLRYLRYLGFKIEGKMRKFYPGEDGKMVDCYMMAIVKE